MYNIDTVLNEYPDAGIVWLNKNKCYVGSEGRDGNKMDGGKDLSGQFDQEWQAWVSAARKVREAQDG